MTCLPAARRPCRDPSVAGALPRTRRPIVRSQGANHDEQTTSAGRLAAPRGRGDAMSVKRRRLIAGGVLAAIAAAAILLVLTSGEDTASTAPAGSTPAGAQGTMSAALETCLQDNGVDPTEAAGHQGTPSPQLLRAFQACQRYQPQGASSPNHSSGATPSP